MHETGLQDRREAVTTAKPTATQAIEHYLPALLDGDLGTCTNIVDATLQRGATIPALYQDLMQPALYRVGDLWADNQISVAREHLATATSESVINHLYPRVVNPRRNGRKAVLALVEDELHQVGLLMVANIFEMQGWDVVYPGASLNTNELLALLENERPDMLGLSLTVDFHQASLVSMIARVRERLPTLEVLIGGQGAAMAGAEVAANDPHTVVIASLDALIAHLASVHR